jgi:enoyl-CoA hydratase/carnithine racemase
MGVSRGSLETTRRVTSSDAGAVRYELREQTAWVTLDRPTKRNALREQDWRALGTALERAADEAHVAVLEGAGAAFCAGDDVATLADLETAADGEALGALLAESLFGIERLAVPVVAAVDGAAYGGGCELVAACDLAVATEDARFALPETKVGAYPPYAVARPGAFGGKKRLLELALTGEPVDAAQALEWGLVSRVVPEDGLADAVAALVDATVEAPKPAVRLLKRYARAGVADGDERDLTADGFARVAESAACHDAAEAFLDGT